MNNLKQYRKRAGLTQDGLAEKAGISPRTLQDYEQGQKPLEKAAAITVLNLARALGCTVEDLIAPPDLIIDRSTWASVQKKLKDQAPATYTRTAKGGATTPAFRKATPAPPPLGYKWQAGQLVVDGEEAAVVKRAVEEMAKDGQLSHETHTSLAAAWKKRFDEKATRKDDIE